MVALVSARDGSGRLFAVVRDGRILIRDGAAISVTPFLNITHKVAPLNPFAEAGLLDVEFPSDYATSGRFYVFYNRAEDGASIVSRFQVSSGNPQLADANSEEVLLVVHQTSQYPSLQTAHFFASFPTLRRPSAL